MPLLPESLRKQGELLSTSIKKTVEWLKTNPEPEKPGAEFPPPQGYRYLNDDELVEPGDLWCHMGTFNRQWLPAKKFGQQLIYNIYCRKVADQADVANEFAPLPYTEDEAEDVERAELQEIVREGLGEDLDADTFEKLHAARTQMMDLHDQICADFVAKQFNAEECYNRLANNISEAFMKIKEILGKEKYDKLFGDMDPDNMIDKNIFLSQFKGDDIEEGKSGEAQADQTAEQVGQATGSTGVASGEKSIQHQLVGYDKNSGKEVTCSEIDTEAVKHLFDADDPLGVYDYLYPRQNGMREDLVWVVEPKPVKYDDREVAKSDTFSPTNRGSMGGGFGT